MLDRVFLANSRRVIPTPKGRAYTTRAKGMNTILGIA